MTPSETTDQALGTALADIADAMRASDPDQAAEIADAAVARGAQHPVLFNVRALRLERQGRDAEALAEYMHARALAPNETAILGVIGLCLMRLHRNEEAVSVFADALRLAPSHAPAHYRYGRALQLTGKPHAAEAAFRRAVILDPRMADAFGSLAAIVYERGDFPNAQIFANQALALDPAEPTAVTTLAQLDIANKRFTDAEARLSRIVGSPRLSHEGDVRVRQQLAQARAGQNKADEPFEAVIARNAHERQRSAAKFEGPNRAIIQIERLIFDLKRAPQDCWRGPMENAVLPDAPEWHVFLIGFPNSGTELIAQILRLHPAVIVQENRDCLMKPANHYLSNTADLEKFTALSDRDISVERSSYWKAVSDAGIDWRGKVFVDCLTQHSTRLPLIAKFFPYARILSAVRDPRDVVLDCFLNNFVADPVSYEMASLGDGARFYAAVMQLVELARNNISLRFNMQRYEDILQDYDARLSAICDFMGLSWHPAMLEFGKSLAALQTASDAEQMRRGLYPSGIAAWRKHASHLGPALPALEPWIERFVYTVE